jgi:hypothetical protein
MNTLKQEFEDQFLTSQNHTNNKKRLFKKDSFMSERVIRINKVLREPNILP